MEYMNEFLKRKSELRSSYINLLIALMKANDDCSPANLYLERYLEDAHKKLCDNGNEINDYLYKICSGIVRDEINDTIKLNPFYNYVELYIKLKPLNYNDLETQVNLYYQDLFDEYLKKKYKDQVPTVENNIKLEITHDEFENLELIINTLLQDKFWLSEFKDKLSEFLAIDEGREINTIKLSLIKAMSYKDRDSGELNYYLK